MGAGLTKNKLSPEPKRSTPRSVTLVAPPKNEVSQHSQQSHKNDRSDQAPEDEFFEKVANNYMKRDRKSFHTGGTTYAGVDLRLEIDSVDTPAMEEPTDTVSYEEEDDIHSETSEYGDVDDGYYTTAEKVLYEKPKPKPDNTQFIVSWKKGTLLGSGGFGKVYLGLDNETGAMFAVKEISLGGDAYQQSKELKSFKQEVAVMKNLRHENIVQYLGTQEDGNELHIFLEYVPGGSIAFILSKFGSFSEPLVKRYTRQILLGLEYLHSHHIIHRDIKGANILVDNCGVVKLADFGASKKMEALMTTTGGYQSLKGTPYWMAPEVIRQSGYGRQADIWSVGCTVIEMATGKPPFHEFTDQVSVLFHIASSNSPPPIPSHLSPLAQDFLLKCFERNPMNRPNARGLLDHPFLKEDSRKLSGNNSGFNSPKTSHSNFSSPRNKDAPPVQFAKEEPRQPSPHIQPAQRPVLSPIQQPPPPMQADADNMIEEPTWTWGGDKRKINFADKFSNDLANNYTNYNSKRDSMTATPSSRLPDPDSPMEIRRHKRAISVTPEKMIPSITPQDTNTPPPARLSMRRHSALESSLREASEFFKLKEAGNLPSSTSQHSNGLCSSPSTPGRTRTQPEGDSPFNNFNMANFNNTFNQSFNSINNTNVNISQYGNNMSLKTSTGVPILPTNIVNNNNNSVATPSQGKRYSPSTPRRELVEEEDIYKFLKTTTNELMQSTKDLSKFTEKRPDPKPADKLPDITEHRRKPSQISPKKFSDGMMDISEEASDAKFKKRGPGTTTTTIVLNTSAINQHNNGLRTSSNSISSPNGSSGNLVISNGKDSLREKDRDSYRERGSILDRDRGDTGVSVNKSGGIVRNAW